MKAAGLPLLPRGLASRSFEDPEDGNGPMKCTQSTAIGGNMLAMEGLDTQEISEFVKGTAKSARRGEALEASHGSVSILDPAMVLLKSVVEIHVGPMPDRVAQVASDCCWIGIVAVSGDAIRHDTGH